MFIATNSTTYIMHCKKKGCYKIGLRYKIMYGNGFDEMLLGVLLMCNMKWGKAVFWCGKSCGVKN
jgi:hypothetical protein